MGRPAKRPPQPGERVSLGLRGTAETKSRLDDAAKASGRSQSQEAEIRLEQSFGQEEAWGGREMRHMSMLMGSTFAVAGDQAARGSMLNGDQLLQVGDGRRHAALLQHHPDPSVEQMNQLFESMKGRFAAYLNKTGADDMRGNIIRRGATSWRLEYDIAPDPVTGARRSKLETVRGTKREAQAVLNKRLAEIDDRQFVERSGATVAE